jgi:uncharacterized circularly permuted ATP-grasp superfamily protein/uncharacterized alpha-E superfamily protein
MTAHAGAAAGRRPAGSPILDPHFRMPEADSASPSDPREDYRTAPGHDEAFEHGGETRRHWAVLFDSLRDLGPAELGRRWREARDLIRENGVTYNVYGDPAGIARPWQLDPIPLLIPPDEAAALERGLVQRARLLELVLSDLYGPQNLLSQRLLPPELVYANPGFLRAVHGIETPGGRYLHLYAANLGRDAGGRWVVIGDRTQAPSGAGYALENRIVMTRTLPEAFRDCRVHRLALFFQTFRDTLRALAPRNKENPRVVLLTPGPYNETYFEHAYLARYLGYSLVEGGDLTVRDNRVFLKVLGGLQPVEVIFRRLDDDFCDPLELRPDSFLGVPGLVHAVRSGNVAVANALGTGLLETPALTAFLTRLCREFLGEDLRLDSVPTWWCGEPQSLRHVLERLDDLVIKPAFPASRIEPAFPAGLSAGQRAELAGRIRERPREYVAQARLDLSSTPVLSGGRLVPRKMVMRSYLAADGGGGFAYMPGGLTRVSAAEDTMVVSMQQGGGSKDTWVLADSAVSEFSLLPAGGSRVTPTRSGGSLPSRAADNLFWLGRYAERAEGLTRLLRGIFVRLAERPGLGDCPELPYLLRVLAARADPKAPPPDETDDLFSRIFPMVFGRSDPHTLASVVRTVRQSASIVRDLISLDMWRVVNTLGELTDEAVAGPTPAEVLDLLNRTVITLAAFGGLASDSMTRGEGWRFLDIGRRLERSLHLIELLRTTLERPAPQEGPVLDAVLEVVDSGMTYRRRYLSSLQAEPVLDLVMEDETNPRSLASQLVALVDDVDHLPRPPAGRSPEQRFALAALDSVRLAEPGRLAAVEGGTRLALRDLLKHVGGWLPLLSDAITQQYLGHLQTSRHLAVPEEARRTAADSGDRL